MNSPGVSEIPAVVFEELLVNALVHRDYLISAPIRLFVFDDRIEVISPGTLPNNLTIENIRAGNSNLRNPILASFVAKGVLPYRGLGSGVPRALEAWPDIEFRDDRDGSLFVATVKRKALAPGEAVDDHAQNTAQQTTQKTAQRTAQKTAQTTPQKLLDLISQDPSVTRQTLAEALGITPDGVKYHLRKLQEQGRLRSSRPRQGWPLGGGDARRTEEAMTGSNDKLVTPKTTTPAATPTSPDPRHLKPRSVWGVLKSAASLTLRAVEFASCAASPPGPCSSAAPSSPETSRAFSPHPGE